MSPLILISPSTEHKGAEFDDSSISLSNRYSEAVANAGGIPVVIPCLQSRKAVAEAVSHCDGVILSGGDDVQTKIYAPDMPKELAEKAGPAEPERDVLELMLIDEV